MESTVERTARAVADKLRQSIAGDDVRILGAAPAPIARLRANYRFHLQIAAPTVERVRDVWMAVEKNLELPDGVEMAVDVDPINSR